MVYADLHCHSTCSDGSLTVKEIARLGRAMGVSVISITDHDSIEIAESSARQAAQMGLGAIPGTEFSCCDVKRGRPAHLLCYFAQATPVLCSISSQTESARAAAGEQMLERLKKEFRIDPELVYQFAKDAKAIHKQHLMRAMVEMGYATTIYGELFNELFASGKGRIAVSIRYPDIREVAQAVRQAGGIAVLAHPGLYHGLDLLYELAKDELIDGAELYHPRNGTENLPKIAQIIEDFSLLKTGGSDFHGMYCKSSTPLGKCGCDQKTAEALCRCAQREIVRENQ